MSIRKIRPGECARKLRDVVTVNYTNGRVIVWLIDGSAIEFSGSLQSPITVQHYDPQSATQLAEEGPT